MSPRLQTMKRIRTISKRLVFAVFGMGFVALQLLTLMPQQKVAAAGETYKWTDYQTISITGGDLGGAKLIMQNDVLNPNNKNDFGATVTYKNNQCVFGVTLKTNGTNSGTYDINLGQQIVTAPGQPGLCSQDIMKSFNGKTVAIGGTRPSDGSTEETDAQKKVYITVQSAKPASDSPGSVTVTIKNEAGNDVVDGPTTAAQSVPGWENDSTPANQRAVEYDADFSLNPGNYQVCIDNLLNTCYKITKEKYKSANFTFGDTITDQAINVTIDISYRDAANKTRTFGPVDITRQNADGSGSTTTISSDTVTHEPTPDQLDSTEYADIETWLHGTFNNVPAGKYKICVPNIDECKEVTKKDGETLEVTFDTNKATELTSGYDDDKGNACPKQIKSWGLQFVACPLFSAADTAINKLEDFVTGMLTTDTEGIFGSSTEDGSLQQSDAAKAYYASWNSFRILAIALITIVGVVMVVSEALGLAIFDAYTIRKILPRLLIAMILISVSWWAMKEIVQFFNNITIWVGNLIQYPFRSFSDSGGSAWTIVGQWSAILAATVALGPFGILSYAGTIFLALMVAALTLIARRMLVTLAIIGAPFFIAAFVAPNTEKLGKFWRDGFIGMMLMGPVFTGMVSLGRVLSEVSHDSDPFGIISLASLIIPVLSIPIVFAKLGGGAAALVGFMNDKSKGGFDRLKNYRTNEVAQRGERAKNGNLFGNGLIRGGAAAKLNKFTFAGSSMMSGDFKHGNPLTKAGRAQNAAALTQRRAILGAGYSKSPEGSVGHHNDGMNRALTYADEQDARANMIQDFDMYNEQAGGDYIKNDDGTFTQVADGTGTHVADTEGMERAISAAKANGGFGEARRYQAALSLSMSQHGYDNLRQVVKTISRVADGNAATAGALAGTINNMTKKIGVHAHAIGVGGYVGPNGLVTKQMAADAGRGPGPTDADYRKASIDALEGVDIATFARNDPHSVANVTKDLYQSIVASHSAAQHATNENDRQKAERDAARFTALLTQIQNNARFSSPKNIQTVHDNTVGADAAGLINQIRANATPSQPRSQTVLTRQTDAEGNVQIVQNTTTTPAGRAPMPHMQEETEIYVQPRPNNRNNNRDRFGPAA